MRSIFSLMTLLLVACGSASLTDRLLADVWARDQQPRLQLQELTRAVTVEGRTELIDSLLVVVDRVERLDSLRVTVGLSPLSDYLRQLTEATGITAQYDPALTVEELNTLRGKEVPMTE